MSVPTNEKILLVDDDRSLLQALQRAHRKRYRFHLACGAQERLEALTAEGPFAVVVADYHMPGMNGASFLNRVKQIAPETVRVMLTGQADQRTAIDAVNRGEVFRFLTKPCDDEVFAAGLNVALHQYRLIQAERVLLEQTLRGAIQVLAEVLALTNPEAFGKAVRVRHYVSQMVAKLGLADAWRYESAALLSQIGCVAVPQETLQRACRGEPLGADEQSVFDRHPQTARKLLSNIPRLEEIAEIVAWQENPGAAPSGDSETERTIAMGALIVALANAFDDLARRGQDRATAIRNLRTRFEAPREVWDALASVKSLGQDAVVRELSAAELRSGMIVDQDVIGRNGALVVPRGHEITVGMLERLRNYAAMGSIPEPIRVRLPLEAPNPSASLTT